MRIDDLNLDIYHDLAGYLTVDQIVALRSCSKQLLALADDVFAVGYLSRNKRKVYYEREDSDLNRMLRQDFIDTNWASMHFHSTQLLSTQSSIPVLVTHKHLLILGSRSAVFVWDRRCSRYIRFVIANNKASFDITGLVVVEYVGNTVTLITSHVAGLIQRVVLDLHTRKARQSAIYTPGKPITEVNRTRNVRTLQGNAENVISAGEIGTLSIYKPKTPWLQPETVSVNTTRLWGIDANYVNNSVAASHNYSHTTRSSISLFNLNQSRIDNAGVLNTPDNVSSFTITNGHTTNGVLASPDILIGGFYDSTVRIYDLRTGYNQVASYEDGLDIQPVYSLDVGGGHDSYICAGSALYSRLRVIDARMTGDFAHHIFAAHSSERSSPVYQLKVSHSHCYIATDSKVHELDFSRRNAHSQFPSIRC
ncbi:hypothetical protein E3Q22_02876 [Wallemia mellicola]|uniref:WD40 repeat-like protein n=1 Tax=Wallemia mellicola TaxID=1708541 RepID=A0A4V4N0S9_9BASI|nr:hypothetical protein E3Q22_02876 [Wallemia mellicola]TIB91484.1 hypothetical protein E3Q19_02400 [Wallemia mellicola]TIB97226.1 hypothetical protein E3Q18_02709 [Wallemia mellicola]TIC11350.1 hypothetical protein E3Q15_02672 [Wallemia mellicola]TIC29465.1 hypothetical protein E3Q10_02571 [Wallemia mellicola]